MGQLLNKIQYSEATGEVTGTTNTAAIDLTGLSTFSAQIVLAVDTPGAKTFGDTAVDTAAETITVTAHGYPLGLKLQASSTGTLPGGMATSTNYFVIPVSTNVLKLASSLANALAGTPINLTSQSSAAAVNTLTPTALAGATVQYQVTNNGTDWDNVGSATAITVTTTFRVTQDTPEALSGRFQFVVTAGSMSATLYYIGKGFQ